MSDLDLSRVCVWSGTGELSRHLNGPNGQHVLNIYETELKLTVTLVFPPHMFTVPDLSDCMLIQPHHADLKASETLLSFQFFYFFYLYRFNGGYSQVF